MSKWMVAAKRADFHEIAKEFQISPMLARIIRNRDVITKEEIDLFLHGTWKDMNNPFLLKDMEKAVSFMVEQIDYKKKIRIIGDYDIDGVCSTYILYKGLSYCGAIVDTAIPHRMKDGYGLNENLIQEAFDAGTQTIITCDNGIAASGQIAFANELGMHVVVTDHHEVPYEEIDGVRSYILPPAVAVVDPKQEDCQYPFSEICGAVVAYKFVLALISRRENKTWQEVYQTALGQELMEFAAFATIGDVMELREENRIIVKEGLNIMHHSHNLGLKALMDVNKIEPENVKPYTIGFVLGPCLNATGRLDTACTALELFQSKDRAQALTIAGDLKAMNDSRKELTLQGVEEAILQIEGSEKRNQKVLVVYLPDMHESLAGIVAGRIREKYGKPTFVLTRAEDGVKGSGRSIEGFHMYDEMTKCKNLFTKYGGHKLAAGLSLPEENIETLIRTMNENCTLSEEDFEEKILIDVPMPMQYATMDFVNELEKLEPFGNGNPKPLFAQKNVVFEKGRRLGVKNNAAKYQVTDENGLHFEIMHFGDIEGFDSFLSQKFGAGQMQSLYERGAKLPCSIIYYPDINEYRGQKNVQLVMKYYQ